MIGWVTKMMLTFLESSLKLRQLQAKNAKTLISLRMVFQQINVMVMKTAKMSFHLKGSKFNNFGCFEILGVLVLKNPCGYGGLLKIGPAKFCAKAIQFSGTLGGKALTKSFVCIFMEKPDFF